jgi:hypothetical protein
MSPHTRHVLFAPFALLALLGACFSDPGSTFYEDGVTSADATSSGTTDVPTVPETTGTDPDFTEPDAATASDATTSPGGCVPVEVPLGSFSAGITQTFPLDFDDFPGAAGEEVEICATFVTANWASARTITIDGEEMAFGPCGTWKPEPESFTGCASYTKPAGPADVTLDNTPFSAGCQSGPMDDVVLRFGCPP